MVKLRVNCDQLNGYGEFLETTSKDFKAIKSSMENIVAGLSSAWDGYDSKNFIGNATEYLKNLQTLEQVFAKHGDVIRKQSNTYNNIQAEFFNIIGG